ncbi:glycosyltransferase [Streptomyces sporangiiformans]|uniref:glycosyltransferase n=1 Tax=Streptomyces sporangiiformans TaxID=2315329 RepID=UPI001F09A1F0|nr:glycosyltransferase [Streptomyces sporangiiformans]
MSVRWHFHDYRSPDLDGIVDGAILMHREMAELLDGRGAVPHDLTRGPDGLHSLLREGGPQDAVYAGSGPYAFLYHLWRERTGGAYRIVREVHTSLWSGYWAQEELCRPLVRDGDLVLFPTEFTRRLYLREFDSVREESSAVAYPLLHRLPTRRPVAAPPSTAPLRIGYLGALSEAKNFDQVVNIFARVHRLSGGLAKLLFAGKPNADRFAPVHVLESLRQQGIDPRHVTSAGVLGPNDLGRFFQAVDVLLFPSTASRETLGRVVVEALAHGVPVLAADVGPAVELLPATNLIPTVLDTATEFTMGRILPLGRVDEECAADRLLRRAYAPARLADTAPYGIDALWQALEGRAPSVQTPYDRRVIDALRVEPRPTDHPGLDPERAERLFLDYFQRHDDELLVAIADLEARTGRPHPELREIVARPGRNLADYRAFPRLLDALLLEPLTFRQTAAQPPCPATDFAAARGPAGSPGPIAMDKESS